jgi:hypothetical protein
MAFIVCESHGGHGAVFVCPHVQEAVLHQRKADLIVVRVSTRFEGQVLCPIYACNNCAENLGIGQDDVVLEDESWQDCFSDDIDMRPVCPFCLDDAFPGVRAK